MYNKYNNKALKNGFWQNVDVIKKKPSDNLIKMSVKLASLGRRTVKGIVVLISGRLIAT